MTVRRALVGGALAYMVAAYVACSPSDDCRDTLTCLCELDTDCGANTGTTCRLAVCSESGKCGFENAPLGTKCLEDDGEICDGEGSCVEASMTACQGAKDCPKDYFCSADTHCVEQFETGQPCDDDEQCSTGFCGGGVCCDSECDGRCEGCLTGTCAPLEAGSEAKDGCDGGSCDTIGACANGALIWVRTLSGYDRQKVYSVAVSGNAVIVTASTTGEVDFGEGISTTEYSLLLVSYSHEGMIDWTRLYEGRGTPWTIGTDSAGNVFASGLFQGTIDFGGGTLTNGTSFFADAFALGVDNDGKHRWSKNYAGPGYSQAHGMAVTEDGGLFLVGEHSGEVDFGGGALATSSQTAFVARLGPDGAHVWSHSFAPGKGWARSVAAFADQSALVAGRFFGTIDFGPLLTAGVDGSVFLMRVDADGKAVWSRKIGFDDVEPRVAVGVDGTVAMAGGFSTNTTIDDVELSSFGGTDAYVVILDSDGTALWGRRFGDPGAQRATALAIDSQGNVIIAGEFEGTIDLGGDQLVSAGSTDIFVAKLTSSGVHLWSHRFGGKSTDRVLSVAASADGHVVLGGTFRSVIDFGDGFIESKGDEDGFVVMLSP
ncbi:hypothetical protein JYT22_00040 [Endomicrobium sp. AH-315-J14]|nr:hypothetical protein [Endomicrobium sp. AH-315-J14]